MLTGHAVYFAKRRFAMAFMLAAYEAAVEGLAPDVYYPRLYTK